MHHDELWQLFHQNGAPLLDAGYPSAFGNPKDGSIYGVTVIWLYRLNRGELELLFQQRGPGVDKYPGDWDISAGGHINFKEPVLAAAQRELKEEIGVTVSADDLVYVCSACRSNNSIYWCYAIDWSGRPDDFHFTDGEVSAIKWVPFSQLDNFLESHAKPPLRGDQLHFTILKDWLIAHGHLQSA